MIGELKGEWEFLNPLSGLSLGERLEDYLHFQQCIFDAYHPRVFLVHAHFIPAFPHVSLLPSQLDSQIVRGKGLVQEV